jgi:hypothetical protein
MKLFAVFREGIYRHECVGIFSTRKKAATAADTAANKDVDGYHTYAVVPFYQDKERPMKSTKYQSPDIIELKTVYSARKKG